jgi:hypothetical protein
MWIPLRGKTLAEQQERVLKLHAEKKEKLDLMQKQK